MWAFFLRSYLLSGSIHSGSPPRFQNHMPGWGVPRERPYRGSIAAMWLAKVSRDLRSSWHRTKGQS
jgi:hypothetical protein